MIALRLLVAGVIFVLLWTFHPAAGQTPPLTRPTSLQILAFRAWNNVVEEGDRFYLVTYQIVYTNPEARPAGNAGETMVIRLARMSSGQVYQLYREAIPTPFVFEGYVRGISGMYFAPDTASSDMPPWNSTVYAQIIGNPVLTWSGGQPVSNLRTPSLYSSNGATDEDFERQQAAIATYLRSEIPVMEQNWLATTGTITDLIAGAPTLLTASGEEYFLQASPDQRSVTPSLYSFNTSNPDLLPIGKARLTSPASNSDDSISVSDVAGAGFRASQELMLIGASVNEKVTIESISDNSLQIAPPLTHSYPVRSEVWVVSQSTQTPIEERIEGSVFEMILKNGAEVLGLSTAMFGVVASLTASAGGGIFVGVALSSKTNYGYFVGMIAAILILLLLTFFGFMHIAGLGIIATIVLALAFWLHFFR